MFNFEIIKIIYCDDIYMNRSIIGVKSQKLIGIKMGFLNVNYINEQEKE